MTGDGEVPDEVVDVLLGPSGWRNTPEAAAARMVARLAGLSDGDWLQEGTDAYERQQERNLSDG